MKENKEQRNITTDHESTLERHAHKTDKNCTDFQNEPEDTENMIQDRKELISQN